MDPKISIIIPVYNGEKYIERCLESVIKQTLREIEILIVDDGSTDNSLLLLESYKHKDGRIHIISQANQGLSGARNTGIQVAAAKYIMFLDIDDWVDEDTCRQVYETMEIEGTDIVFWTYIREYEATALPKVIFKENHIFEEEECKILHRRFVGIVGKELLDPEQSDAIVTAWAKLYKREIIIKQQIQFMDLKKIGTYEDGLFNLDYFKYVKRAAYINKCFNHYYKVNESSLTKTYKGDLFNQYQVLLETIQRHLGEQIKEDIYRQALNNRRAMSLIGIGLTECIHSNPKSHLKRIKFIKEILKTPAYQQAYKQMEIKYLPFKWKLFYSCAKYQYATGVYILLQIINYIISR